MGCGSVNYKSITYTNSTIVHDTLHSQTGCDSVYKIVNIVVVNPITQNITMSGCNSIVYNSVTYSNSTIVRDTIKSSLCCDSIYKNATLSINQIIPSIQTLSFVGCNSVIYNSVTYTSSTVLHDTLHSYQDCDSGYKTINITVHHLTPTTNTTNVSGCNNVVYNSNTYTSSTVLRDTIISTVSGCDSIYNVVNIAVITVNAASLTINVAGCDSATYNSITITNNGTLPITLNGISVAAPYSGSVSSQTINASNSVNILISFTPTATLFYTKTLTISTSIGDFTATLQGRGVNASPAWVISPSNRNFGNVQVGDSATQTFAITNTGNVAILTSTITSNNSLFSAKTSNTTIAVGGTATITAKFKPTAISGSNAVITVNTTTNGLASLAANLSGTGYINNTPPTLNFISANPYNGTFGVNPNVGQAGNYTYRIVYKSTTKTPPQLGYPKLGIDKNGDGDYIDNDEGTFIMNKVNSSTNWVAGEEFTYSTTLNVGNNYGYRFFANDSLGNPATLANAAHNNGPVVTDQTLDLKIFASDITFSVAHPNVGQTFTVFATIHNSTPYSASNVNIRFYTDSLYNNQTTLPFIGANSSAVVSMNFVYNTEGFYPIKVWIDSANNLGETNALNNYAIRPIIVGAFSVPATILVTSNAYPQTCPTGVVFSGNACYSGLNLIGNPPVLGATVTVKVNGVEVGSTYTITDGNWSVYVPYNCGTNNYQVEVTDFTSTGSTAVQNFAIPCGVSCGSSGGGNYNYEPYYYTSASAPCCLINNQSFNYALSIVNNGTASSYKDTIKVFVDGNLSYTHKIDSLQVNQAVNYNDAFVLATGNHTLSYTHSYYNAANVRSEVNGSTVVYVEQNLPDLYLASFSQTGNTAFSVRNYNSTCTVAGASKLFIYETNSSYGSPALIDSVASTSVSGGKCSNTSVLLNYNRPSWTLGYHYLTLTTDGSNAVSELNELNNSINVVIYVPQPDLYVSNIDVSNSDVHSGDAVNFIATIRNNGAASTTFKVQFKVDNVAIGNKITIASLGVGSSTTISSDAFNIPSSNCPLYIKVIADVDNQVTELVETNNADSINFASDLTAGYGCYATGSSCNPYVVYIGKNLDMQSIITNAGLRDVDTTHIRFKIGGTIIGSDNVNHIASNSSVTTSISNTFNTVGSYVIAIEADYDNQYCESNEGNNIGYIYVTAVNALPDLRILSQHISPSNLNPAPGQSISVVSTVQNIGNLASTPAMVRFWVDDVQLGVDVAINSIKPGRDTTVAATLTYSNNVVGPKILKVRADINNQVIESDTTNNAATRAIIVGGAPDFARSINEGITFSRQLFRKGKQINISNYIRNFGGDTGRAVLKFFYATPTSKVLFDSVQFRLDDHDSIRVSTKWVVAIDSGRIITEIVGANPQEFNVINNVDSIDFVTDKRVPSISITNNLQSVCEGVAIVFSATSQNVVAPVYRWKLNGVTTGDTLSTITKVLSVGSNISCDLYDVEMYLKTSSELTPTIRNKTYSITQVSKCSSQLPFFWNGTNYSLSGTYTKTFMNAQGCDSVATLQLTVLQSTSSVTTDNINVGNSYLFNGNYYTTSGTYTIHFVNANGCDSAAILVLTVKSVANGAAITGNLKSCSLNTINWLGCSVAGGVWKSSDTIVAKINNLNGGITSFSNGATNITYTYKIGNIIYVSNAVYVVAAVSVPQSIGGLNNVCVGATILMTNATNGGVWTSLNNRASIDANTGVLTGLNGGEYPAVIKYSVYNISGCSASISRNVNVNAIPTVPSITYAPGTNSNPQAGAPTGSFCVGKVFGVSGTPSTPGFGTWSSTGVANITAGGIVTITATGSGSIKYTYTNANGCSNNRTMQGNGFSCAARGVSMNAEPITVNNDFVMYPNPAKSVVSILVDKFVGEGKIIVTDLYGKTVKIQNLSMGTNTVDIANLTKGFYLVSVVSNENKITKKLVIE